MNLFFTHRDLSASGARYVGNNTFAGFSNVINLYVLAA